jgi:hypothetical protein
MEFHEEDLRSVVDDDKQLRGALCWSCKKERDMKWTKCHFGSIEIDGTKYSRDLILDRGEIGKRKKKPSRVFREQYGHTPLSLREKIPWKCKRLVIGTGMYGRLPVMQDVLDEAKRRGVEVVQHPTPEAVKLLNTASADTNASVHVTC